MDEKAVQEVKEEKQEEKEEIKETKENEKKVEESNEIKEVKKEKSKRGRKKRVKTGTGIVNTDKISEDVKKEITENIEKDVKETENEKVEEPKENGFLNFLKEFGWVLLGGGVIFVLLLIMRFHQSSQSQSIPQKEQETIGSNEVQQEPVKRFRGTQF